MFIPDSGTLGVAVPGEVPTVKAIFSEVPLIVFPVLKISKDKRFSRTRIKRLEEGATRKRPKLVIDLCSFKL